MKFVRENSEKNRSTNVFLKSSRSIDTYCLAMKEHLVVLIFANQQNKSHYIPKTLFPQKYFRYQFTMRMALIKTTTTF